MAFEGLLAGLEEWLGGGVMEERVGGFWRSREPFEGISMSFVELIGAIDVTLLMLTGIFAN